MPGSLPGAIQIFPGLRQTVGQRLMPDPRSPEIGRILHNQLLNRAVIVATIPSLLGESTTSSNPSLR